MKQKQLPALIGALLLLSTLLCGQTPKGPQKSMYWLRQNVTYHRSWSDPVPGPDFYEMQKVWYPVREKLFDQYPWLLPISNKIATVYDSNGYFRLLKPDGKELKNGQFDWLSISTIRSQSHFIGTKGDTCFIISDNGEITATAPYNNYWWLPQNEIFAIEENGLWGLMRKDGQLILPPQFISIFETSGGKLIYQTAEGVGVMTREQKVLIAPENQHIMPLEGGYYKVYRESKAALFSPKGKQLTPFKFLNIQLRKDRKTFFASLPESYRTFHLYNIDGEKKDSTPWEIRSTQDLRHYFYYKPRDITAEEYSWPAGEFITDRVLVDTIDYPLSYSPRKSRHNSQNPSVITFENGCYKTSTSGKIYAPDGRQILHNGSVTHGFGSLFVADANYQNLKRGVYNLRGKQILGTGTYDIEPQPEGIIIVSGLNNPTFAINYFGDTIIHPVKYGSLFRFFDYLIGNQNNRNTIYDMRGRAICSIGNNFPNYVVSGHFIISGNDSTKIFSPKGNQISKYGKNDCFYIHNALRIRQMNKWGVFSIEGDTIIAPIFDSVWTVNGFFTFFSTDSMATYAYDLKYIAPGRVVPSDFEDGIIISDKHYKQAYYSQSGKQVLPFAYDQIFLKRNAKNYIGARIGDTCYVYDLRQNLKCKFQADSITEWPYRNIIVFKRSGKRWMINPENGLEKPVGALKMYVFDKLMILANDTSSILLRKNDFSRVSTEEFDIVTDSSIFRDLNYGDQLIISQNGRYGIIDTNGVVSVPFVYDEIQGEDPFGTQELRKDTSIDLYNPLNGKSFESGTMEITKETWNAGYYVKSGDKVGFIDFRLNWVIPLQYSSLQRIDQVGFVASEGSQFGALTLRGDILMPFIYKSLYYREYERDWVGQK